MNIDTIKRFSFTFIVCLATWLVLSGKFDVFHISMGVISCMIVALFSSDLLVTDTRFGSLASCWWRFVRFAPWLLYQVFLANLHVMRLVFHPRMHELISPRIIRFKTRLTSDMAKFVLANSITLTPGTITVFASVFGTFTVHVIDEKCQQGVPGEMQTRIARIFEESI
jgi:multicomponent Na+:H+ antiporter subunit E